MTTQRGSTDRRVGNQYVLDGAFNRFLMRLPILLWRLGLGPVLPMALLTAPGRKSGLPRRTPLYPHVIGDQTYLWSPYGGRPQWFRNALAASAVTLQWHRGTRVLHAVPLSGPDEASDVIAALRHFSSTFLQRYLDGEGLTGSDEDVARNWDRLHVLRLEPTSEQGPPAAKADLAWTWLAVAAAAAAAVWVSQR